MTGILSHYRAGSGAVCVETREEARLLRELLAELPDGADVTCCAAPGGPLRDAHSGRNEQGGLSAGYAWAQAAPGRVLVVYDFHTLCKTPGHWRALIDALPLLRKPRGGIPDGAGEDEIAEALAVNPLAGHASLVVFVGPAWELTPPNPLRGALPVLAYAPPDRGVDP